MANNSNWIPPGFNRDMVGRDFPGVTREEPNGQRKRPDRGNYHGVPTPPERARQPGSTGPGIARDEAEP